MRLLPRTLAGRTLLLVFASVLLCEAATLGIGGYYRRNTLIRQALELVASYRQMAIVLIESTPPAERERVLEAAQRGQGMHIVADASANALSLSPPPRRPHFLHELRDRIGPTADVRFGRDASGRAVWVKFNAGGEGWWIVLPATRFEAPFPWRLALLLAAIIGVVLGLSALFVASVTRGLRDLNDASRALGEGRPHPTMPKGPRELRALAETFNTMLGRLQANERTQRVMLAGLPHDLRAPLTRLRLRLALLANDEARAGIARDADDIERIANQFIAFLHGLDAGKLRRERIDLAALAHERAARYSALDRALRVSAEQPVELEADPVLLARLVDNLLDNAFKHGAGAVEVSVRGNGAAEISVRDHGRGIPAEQRARALQPFQQLAAERDTHGSTGLGLAIVESIARLHGGSVELRDAEGGGLEVKVSLPRQ